MAPDSAESSDDEWEEVEESQKHQEDDVEVKPSESVEIELDVPDAVKKKRKKADWEREMVETEIRRAVKRFDKEMHIAMHKVHLLCLLAMGMRLNRICNGDELRALVYSILPQRYTDTKPKHVSAIFLTRFIHDFTKLFDSDKGLDKLLNCGGVRSPKLESLLKNVVRKRKILFKLDLVLIFVIALRVMGLNTRLVLSLQPLPLKALTEKQKENLSKNKVVTENEKTVSKKRKTEVDIPQIDGANDTPQPRMTRSRAASKNTSAKEGNNTFQTKATKSKKRTAVSVDKKTSIKAEKMTKETEMNQKSKSGILRSPKLVLKKEPYDEKNFVEAEKMTKGTEKNLKCKSGILGSPKVVLQKELVEKENSVDAEKMTNKTKMNLKRRSDILGSPKVVLEKEDLDKVGEEYRSENVKAKRKIKKIQKADKNVDETPLVKPPTNTKAKRQLRTKVKRKISSPTPDSESDCETDFKPVYSSESEDSDFEAEKSPPKKRGSIVQGKKNGKAAKGKREVMKVPARRNTGKKLTNGADYYDQWLEVYSEQERKWISLDVFRCAVNHPKEMEKRASPILHYVLGFENEGYVKDLTARYASKWLTETRKLRVGIADKDWWKDTLSPYATPNIEMDNLENRIMQEDLLAQPIPTTISAFKNHPLFGLRRHLLKYEAIHPPDVPTVGFVRGEEIFPRSAIHCLHTRDKWMQEARVVRDGEEPYKMVASLWINMKLKQDMATLSMPLFGKWQTEPFVPPVAKDGKVPRNQYGNVDLFQPEMIPVGCVQLRLPGLQKVARKLDIDIATAVTGFDSHSGYPHPVNDGYVVCEEYKETLVAAWQEDQIHAAEREKKKRDERVYGHWKFFIKAMLMKERVKRKYATKEKVSKGGNNSEATAISVESGTAWQAKRLEAAKKEVKGRGRRKKKDENMFPFEVDSI